MKQPRKSGLFFYLHTLMGTPKDGKIGLRDAIAIGVGGMVGGGIFAVLGLAADLAKGGTPVAFLIGGIIALLTAYSYAKLSMNVEGEGGTVDFVNKGFGHGIFSGGTNNLLWFSYIIMLSLYASAFGSYAPNLFSFTENTSYDSHIYSSTVIIIAAVINYYSLEVVSRIESFTVIVKLAILIIFVGIGFYGLAANGENASQLSPQKWASPINLITGGMVIFVAYEGFELIANAAGDIKNKEKNIPRAYYISVISVIILYILIAIITIGSLQFDKIREAKDFVLAEVAKPTIGQVGFTIITIAAMLSTFSAINASLYGGSRVSYEIAKDDELPAGFTKSFWNKPIGLLITVILTLLIANTMKLEGISTSGSAGFLLIFAVVNYTAYKFSKDFNASKVITLTGAILCTIALIALIVQQLGANTVSTLISLGIIAVSYLIELLYKKFK